MVHARLAQLDRIQPMLQRHVSSAALVPTHPMDCRVTHVPLVQSRRMVPDRVRNVWRASTLRTVKAV